jgi:uncharacterized protein
VTGETGVADSHGRFIWYELTTPDIAAAKTFYSKVMGWNAVDVSMPGMAYALFTVDKMTVTGVMGLPGDAKKTGVVPRWLGYVGVDDVDAAAARCKELGGIVQVPPRDIPGISRFSIVTDPQMATLALFKGLQPSQPRNVEPDKPGHVSWHELLAADNEAVFAFYSALFGWQKVDAEVGPLGTYQPFSAAGQTIGGMFTKPSFVPAPTWLFYFGVRDIYTAAERVKVGGGQVFEGPLELPDGSWIAQCIDPQGAWFALKGRRMDGSIGYFKRAPARGTPGAPPGDRSGA